MIRSTVLPAPRVEAHARGRRRGRRRGTVAGRPVFCYAQDQTFVGGSLGEAHAETIVRVMQLAGRAGAPVIGFVASGGARMDDGVAALGGYGRIFRENVALSGRVPQISVITGVSAGGGAYSPALTDFVVMTDGLGDVPHRARRRARGDGRGRGRAGARRPAGPRAQRRLPVRRRRTTSRRRASCASCSATCRSAPASGRRTAPPAPAPVADPSASRAGAEPRQVYDVRDVIRALVDTRRAARGVASAGRATWSPRFARIDGRPVGVVANQPWHLGGVIDADASQKAARFVRTCNAFGLPLVVLVDTPGFLPGTQAGGRGRDPPRREAAARVRRGRGAEARRSCCARRYGGGYITMNSKDLGADLAFAWPDAEIGVMGAEAGGGDRAPARDRGGRGPGAPSATGSPTSTPASTWAPPSRRARASSTRSSSRSDDAPSPGRARWPRCRWRGEYGNGTGNIPL